MNAIWKGTISFGLVSIPISLFPATRREELKFRLLRDSDLSPVNYKRVAEADGKEVPWEKIVKGYEYEKEKYVVLSDEDFRRANVKASGTIDIQAFVPEGEIPLDDVRAVQVDVGILLQRLADICTQLEKAETQLAASKNPFVIKYLSAILAYLQRLEVLVGGCAGS